jgi:diamine N-acetyltransferase
MPALRRATEADIPFIYTTERLPGYAPLVGRFEEAEHRADLADANWLYFIGLDDTSAPRGFAILQDRLKSDGNCFLRRIAVTKAGQGYGTPFLTALIDWVFANTSDTRFWLSVRAGNDRARRGRRGKFSRQAQSSPSSRPSDASASREPGPMVQYLDGSRLSLRSAGMTVRCGGCTPACLTTTAHSR